MQPIARRFPRPNRRGILGHVVTLGLALAGVCSRPAAADPPTVQELVDQFSATNYFNLVSNKLYTRQVKSSVPCATALVAQRVTNATITLMACIFM